MNNKRKSPPSQMLRMMRIQVAVSLMLAIVGTGATYAVTSVLAATAPNVALFASPYSIYPGESSRLSWSATASTSCTASDGWSGSKPISSTEDVHPTETTTYTITCVGAGGSKTDSVDVTVDQPDSQLPIAFAPASDPTPAPVSAVIPAPTQTTTVVSAPAPTPIATTTITSTPTQAPATVISTTQTQSPTAPTTATTTAAPSTPVTTTSVVAPVLFTKTPPYVALYGRPYTVKAGQASTLSWSATNSTSCAGTSGQTGWLGSKPTAGSFVVHPTVTTTYTITCTSSVGSKADDVTITVSGTTAVTTPISTTTITPAPAPTPTPVSTLTSSTVSSPTTSYDQAVLTDSPVLYLAMNSAGSGAETDTSGHGSLGTYKGGTPTTVSMPNGDKAADFNGSSQYLTVPSSSSLSISTTHQLTWEAWIRPDTLTFPTASGDAYIDWMGKCQDYSPTCEWEARMYNEVTPEGRPNRLSAYVFNPSAGLGSAADWQPNPGVVSAGKWLHVVAEYQTLTTQSGCSGAGSINIWVNGVKQDFASHKPTGCMSQYNVTPKAGSSPLNIGTMAMDTWFKGAVGKVAVYNHLLSQTQINSHFQSMTGKQPSGSCAASCTVPSL